MAARARGFHLQNGGWLNLIDQMRAFSAKQLGSSPFVLPADANFKCVATSERAQLWCQHQSRLPAKDSAQAAALGSQVIP